MKTNLTRLLGAALLLLAAAGCGRSPVQPHAPSSAERDIPSLPLNLGSDSTGIDTGYFGSGHYLPGDSLEEDPG